MIAEVSNERLTRHEISWLLAQEARGAAKALRDDVTRLTNAPPVTEEAIHAVPSVQTTLDTLDGAINMLTALQARPAPAPASRRGRIDLAALLVDVAPQARIKMAPGEGTEVLGDEAELRRILHMLVNQTHASPSGAGSTASPEVDIRRDGDMVRISVELGPDRSATADLERRWLSRMAVQHGGRLEFKGGRQSVFLPADGATDQREVVELRKELEQAQQLGEAYARELAAVFASGIADQELEPDSPVAIGQDSFQTLVGTAGSLAGLLKVSLDGLREDAALAARELGDDSELALRLNRRSASLQDLHRELSTIAACPTQEKSRTVDAAQHMRASIDALATRADKQQITLSLDAPDTCSVTCPEAALQLMYRALLEHAISATPRGKSVEVRLSEGTDFIEIQVADAGPNVPETARRDVLHHTTDPARLGRPGGISMLLACAVAGRLGGMLSLTETTQGKTQVRFQLPRHHV